MHSIKGYTIHQQIYESSTSLVFRGVRESDRKNVVLKMNRDAHPSPKEVFRYRNEYDILKSLDIDNVIALEGLEAYENVLIIVEEDFGGGIFGKTPDREKF